MRAKVDAYEVNITIAKALGYDWKREENAVAWYKDGERQFGFSVYAPMSDDDIWDYVINEGLIGNWSTDIAAAIELLYWTGCWWEVVYLPEEHIVKVGLSSSPGQSYMAANTSLAMAICVAWLQAKVNENPHGAKAE